MSIQATYNGRHYKVAFEYYDEHGERFKKGDNHKTPSSWCRYPRSCAAWLYEDGEEVGYASSYAHDGENFHRATGRMMAFWRLMKQIEVEGLKFDLAKAFLNRKRGLSDHAVWMSITAVAYSPECNVTGVNLKGEWIPFWVELGGNDAA